MRIESKITYSREEKEELVAQLKKRYGSLTSLQQKVAMRKCTSPEMVDDYMIWKGIEKKDAALTEAHIWKNAEMMDQLTTRRLELLEHIHRTGGESVMALTIALKRNYKNVYDDLLALEKTGLICFRTSGRKKISIARTSEILIRFDD